MRAYRAPGLGDQHGTRCAHEKIMRQSSTPKRACRRGDTIANAYKLRELLGVGGMGVVFAADLDDGQSVAIKVLPFELSNNPRAARRIRDEARAARYVSHPNVVSVLDVSAPDDPVTFVVMERVAGVQLSRVLRGTMMPLRRAADIAAQILAGLDAIHAAGVVHGDINGANILVETTTDGSDAVKIIDFGLATLHRNGQTPELEYDAAGSLLMAGTPAYMAPEVIRGSGAVAASDLYSVAVIIYQMVTGVTPFAGGPPAAIIARHLTDCVVPPSLRCPKRSIPFELEQVILRGLEKEPTARFATAAEFATALAAATPAIEPAPLPVDQLSIKRFTREATTRTLLAGEGKLLDDKRAATQMPTSAQLRRLRISQLVRGRSRGVGSGRPRQSEVGEVARSTVTDQLSTARLKATG